jgi:hypothetical protein
MAILSANISALLPDSILAGLHAGRLQGADINQLRTQMANLQADSARLREENNVLSTQFSLAQEADGGVTRRVGALEISLPKLLEALPKTAEIDRTNMTAAIGAGKTINFEADGGSVSVSQKPFAGPSQVVAPAASQPMPALPGATAVAADARAFGVALGNAVAAGTAKAGWNDLLVKVGPMLVGLGPILGDDPANASAKRLVVGPLTDMQQAADLCASIGKAGVECAPVRFVGLPLPN